MTAPVLALRDVAIRHEGADAATPSRVSFEVAPGEVVLVLGPSGSGKSTLTLALNGLIPHAVPATIEGTVAVAGAATTERSVAELSTHVGMVFQDPDAQLVTGTLLDEVAFGPENLRLPVADVLARAEAALRRVGLWERRAQNPDRLSGGGRQRLAIACALAMGSPLLVLDEPTANLDPAGIDEVYAALAELVAAGERAIVLVEHNLDAAIEIVDRVVALDQRGAVVADGPVDTVLRERADELHAMGVWLPVSTLAALRLRRAGYALDPLPLTPAELHDALAGMPAGTGPAARTAARTESAAGTAEPEPAEHEPAKRRPTQRDAASDAPLVRVEHLSLDRRRTPVLRDVSLQIARGELLAIVGANGAGKTTLAQAVAGVLVPPRGAVTIAGDDISRLSARERARRVGFVFQNPEHQFVAPSVFDEIAHGLRRQHLAEPEVAARTTALLERFGLAEKAESHPFLLSGGQKRRLSVGTALVAGAPLLVLDEPTFGQDRARADELLALLDDLRADGTTIVLVTHDMQLVSEHADRVAVIADGRLAAHDAVSTVFADEQLLARTGLRPPPLARALARLPQHPALEGLARVRDLPGAPA